MPEVEVAWTCDPQHRISSFRIRQNDILGGRHVWPLNTEVLLAYNGESERVPASLDGAEASVPGAIGKGCPDYVFGNNDDHAYGLFLLDPKSQGAVVDQLAQVSDPFRRALLWGALWDGVRERKMTPLAYSELALRLLPAEKDAELAVSILGRVRTAFTDYLSDQQRASITEPFENLLIHEIAEAPSTDLRITYFRGLIAVATTKHARGVLKDLFTGRATIPGVPLKQRDRWNIIAALAAGGDPDGPELLAAETKRDTSDDGARYAYVSGAGFATADNKRKYFAEYLAQSGVKEDWITASLSSFNYWSQTELTSAWLKPALDALPQLKRDRKIFFIVDWLDSFAGNQHSPEALQTVDDFLRNDRVDPDLRLKILEVRDELERTVRIRAQQ
jgi:aminopeptidase N